MRHLSTRLTTIAVVLAAACATPEGAPEAPAAVNDRAFTTAPEAFRWNALEDWTIDQITGLQDVSGDGVDDAAVEMRDPAGLVVTVVTFGPWGKGRVLPGLQDAVFNGLTFGQVGLVGPGVIRVSAGAPLASRT